MSVLEHWYAALNSEKGVVVRATQGDRTQLIQALYSARKKSCDCDLDALSLVQSPTDPTEVWIVKNAKA